ncbi:MAG: 50S ribosomal protein L4 [Parcubacteria group bacterium GW2011_GWB1_49_7]|uniref:Large ribosomal subunit protein uL4 n=1 Tax=Candidatus Zambryskibacteria bacterium RIFCSPHIGHO2_01_FULL_46_25 TaxID=1802738 RepID=A0A1G2SZ51_9BACT|nr:MAG: 50S ribosomal protein L4 [Parcubacteria group bacterium GW2011_GWA1_47_10]KKW09691.1 MAG: 50S ribosomal protein L4 [Parcubacteria group bacterium GW2011_GWB1_49_7]OHA90132.1 MAG: 50S ribosomal protein L4 [Candidatus Zambryskibacteria bacterium RIFCSPHIGHO2_01_FULL_46_25]OHB01311.1 MAG: 50S ribosomal protein L4 [Candidatus Zambryskibacteria bacterium RIFCSPHIGHO2_12_FULL_48_10]OHB06493.1 MAG: 50S ribosomal protein L4 [Candidatus Zambryskibacteria bacterium RIFCSPLOWO2_01_FULL_48_25]
METPVYNQTGKVIGRFALPESIFGLRWNADLVKQITDSILSSRRKNVAHTKNRGEVRGGGKKPWQQKGTGRARHGSTRSPIWVGGGVTHGPRNEKNYARTISKSMRVKALHTILAEKYRDGEILFVDSLALAEPKTKFAVQALGGLSEVKGFEKMYSKRKSSAAIALGSKNKETERAFKNLGNVEVLEARNLDPITLLQYKYLVIENPEVAFKAIPKTKKAKKPTN